MDTAPQGIVDEAQRSKSAQGESSPVMGATITNLKEYLRQDLHNTTICIRSCGQCGITVPSQ
jgi:hypothetical protein